MLGRIIRAGSMRRRHQQTRVLFLGLLGGWVVVSLLLLAGSEGMATHRGLATAATTTFGWVAMVQLAAICLLTPIFMTGSIEQEASPRTWDLLLTTPLSSFGIVAGGLLGRLVFIFSLLLSALPVLLGLQILGGVGPHSVLTATVIAAATAMVVATAAITLSATRTGGRRAVLLYYGGIMVTLAATAALDLAMRTPVSGGGTSTTFLTPLNPFLTLQSVLYPLSYVPAAPSDAGWLSQIWLTQPTTTFIILSLLLSMLMVCWSVLRVRWLGPLLARGPKISHTRQSREVGHNPIAWRASTGRPRSYAEDLIRWSWAAIGLLLPVIMWSAAAGGICHAKRASQVLTAALIAQIAILILVATTQAASVVTRAREQHTMDLLLTTPISPRAYLSGTLQGLARQLTPILLAPMIMLVLCGALLGMFETDLPANWGAIFGLSISLGPFTAFCIVVGLHWSVRSLRTLTALMMSLTICVGAAGLFLPCLITSSEWPWWTAPVLSLSPLVSIDLANRGLQGMSTAPFGVQTALWYLLLCGVVAGAFWSALTYMVLKTTAHGFVPTMRKLAGTE